ncbi:MAG: fumarylacetoacetate hydrolase family protein [Planctomycetes bacterium]|nr:fumarylacetoacetate hydrolase family protein [Planctomycetota bacterium]
MGLHLRGSDRLIVPTKLVCLGANYPAHAAEMGGLRSPFPAVFLKPPSALLPGGGAILLPPQSREVHHEVELAVVIGRRATCVAPERALDHVLGYAVFLDITARDLQAEAKREGRPWALAKGFDTFAPCSEVASARDVGDSAGLAITCHVNGEPRQSSNTGLMSWGVAEALAWVSERMSLEAGDLLAMGTPAGVGPLVAGDRVVGAIERVGSVACTVERRAAT